LDDKGNWRVKKAETSKDSTGSGESSRPGGGGQAGKEKDRAKDGRQKKPFAEEEKGGNCHVGRQKKSEQKRGSVISLERPPPRNE